MKRMSLLAMIIIFGLACVGHARTYKISSYHWIAWSPGDVADAKGFWKDQGLDVRVINFTSQHDLNSALLHKRIDFAIEMIGTWIGFHMEGTPLTILAELDWSHGGDKIIVRKDFEVRNLKGGNVGVFLNNPATMFFLNEYLAAQGMGLSDVRPVELEADDLASNFIHKRLDCVLLYDPPALRAEKEGDGKVVATSARYPGCVPEGLVARPDVLRDIPKEDVVKLLKGWIRAVEWIKEPSNWKAYTEILNARTFEDDPPYPDGELRKMFEGVRIHDAAILRERNRDGGGLSLWLNHLKAMLKENGLLRKDFDPEKIFDNSHVMEAVGE